MQFLRRHLQTVAAAVSDSSTVTKFYATPFATPSRRFPRDTGLDHVILHEQNLKPLINLKNFIKSDPSKSLPLSLIKNSKLSLSLPYRPIDFIRRYPLVFQEFTPDGVPGPPHVRLTKEALELDADEGLVCESVEYRMGLADRVLKLLMIGRRNRMRVRDLEELKWELGLPDRFVEEFVVAFPDYFEVKKGGVKGREDVLELVCWIEELAVSAMEMVWLGKVVVKREGRRVESGKWGVGRRGYRGMKEERVQAFEFPVKYSTGFEMDDKYKMWLDEWQKLPCDSPYGIEPTTVPASKEFDKYAVAVLHEVLNLFVGMKAEKESVLFLGEILGLRARFKKALLLHPGIFYVSSKNRRYTVILRDGYKRAELIKKNPLMEVRSKYLELMHTKDKDNKETDPKKKDRKPKNKGKVEDQENDGSNESDAEEDEEVSGLSNEEGDSEEVNSEEGDSEDDDSEADDEEVSYDEDYEKRRGRFKDETNFSRKRISRGVAAREISSEAMGERSPRSNREVDYQGENSSARSRGSPYVARQGRWAGKENNMSGEKQFSRQRRGADRTNNKPGERPFSRQRQADRQNSKSGERQFNRERRGANRGNNMSGEKPLKPLPNVSCMRNCSPEDLY